MKYLILLALLTSSCFNIGGLVAAPSSFSETAVDDVYVLRGRPDVSQKGQRVLIMVPGVSSGIIPEQVKFLEQVRLRSGAEFAVFFDWSHTDPTRKMASPAATAHAAADLSHFLKNLKPGTTIDILAHSAGTIVTNKTASLLKDSGVKIRHVLFLGTPHDPDVNLDALKSMSKAVLNIHSANDKINRNVSGIDGKLNNLPAAPYWNMKMDTSLGGRKIRHYSFLEYTPENIVGYGCFFKYGKCVGSSFLEHETDITLKLMHDIVLEGISQVSGRSKRDADSYKRYILLYGIGNYETTYFNSIFLGLHGREANDDIQNQARAALKLQLKKADSPAYLRREIYQALGNIANPEDLRYLQRARKTDPAAGDVLRDVLRDWKRKRVRPERERRK